jgi:hypothetical protein
LKQEGIGVVLRGKFTAELTDQEAQALMRPVVGQGGFQTLLRGLQKSYDKKTKVVTLDGDQIEKINRYTSEYGAGGFEDRLDGVRRNLPKLLH